MKRKLNLSIPIYWLTVESACHRHKHMLEQFFQYGVNYHTLVKGYNLTKIRDLSFNSIHLNELSDISISVVLSHLNVIKKFYYESTADMALIFEDDVTFETVNYWPFTLQQVIDRLPANWNVIQLCLIRNEKLHEDLIDIKFRPMKGSSWGLVGYLISRKYAQTLINHYCCPNDTYNIDIVVDKFQLPPWPEPVIFCLGFDNMYTFPIFTENPNFNSTTFEKGFSDIPINPPNVNSRQQILSWWRTNGLNSSLDYFFDEL